MKTGDDSLRKLTVDDVVKLYRFVSERAQKNTPSGDWNVIRSHNMRKYFNSTLRNKGVDASFIEFLMGHSEGRTKEAYYIPNVAELKSQYLKVASYLTIAKDLDISASPEFKRIKEENELLIVETERVHVERSEYAALKEELKALRDATVMRDTREETFYMLMSGYLSERNRGDGFDELYAEHLKNMRIDSEYSKHFRLYESSFIYNHCKDPEHKAISNEYDREKTERRLRISNTLDRLLK
jgi:hypothetical protein